MSSVKFVERIRKAAKRAEVVGVTTVLIGAMTLAPEAAAAWTAKHGEESRVVNYHTVDRAEIENLQRWVAAGHEDWCKDAQLVAAEELKRIAEEFAADATQLTPEKAPTASAVRRGLGLNGLRWTGERRTA